MKFLDASSIHFKNENELKMKFFGFDEELTVS